MFFYCDAKCMGKHREIIRKGYRHSEETKEKMSKSKSREKSYLWNGENPSNGAVHKRLKKILLKPTKCDECKKEKNLELANISPTYNKFTYTENKNNWRWLCRKCHIHSDNRLKNLKQYA